MYILLLAFLTIHGDSGVTLASAEYGSQAACEAAGEAAKSNIAGWTSEVRYSCSPKGGAQ